MEMLSRLVTWLRECSALSILPEDVLSAIAPTLTRQSLPPNQTFIYTN
jgi:hypothetical protein